MTTLNTRKNRKMRIVSKTRFAMSMTLIFIFILSTSMIAFAAFDTDNLDTIEDTKAYTYTVQSGDTLWSIASDLNKSQFDQEKDVRKLIRSIKKINKLNGNTIFAGQVLEMPLK